MRRGVFGRSSPIKGTNYMIIYYSQEGHIVPIDMGVYLTAKPICRELMHLSAPFLLVLIGTRRILTFLIAGWQP